MKIRTRRIIGKALVGLVCIVGIVGILFSFGIATPTQYRFGAWRRLPILDHRLLPHVSAILAAAFGAFFGSLSAFWLGRVQQRADRREKRHAALIGAQYALMSQWNMLEGLRVQYLEKHRSRKNRFLTLGRLEPGGSPTFIPFDQLTFVLESRDPNVLQVIHLAEQSYQCSANALALYNGELQRVYDNPRVKHRLINFDTGESITEASPEDIFFLKEATNALYDTVDQTLPKLAAATEELERLSKHLFPTMKRIKMTAIEGAESQAT